MWGAQKALFSYILGLLFFYIQFQVLDMVPSSFDILCLAVFIKVFHCKKFFCPQLQFSGSRIFVDSTLLQQVVQLPPLMKRQNSERAALELSIKTRLIQGNVSESDKSWPMPTSCSFIRCFYQWWNSNRASAAVFVKNRSCFVKLAMGSMDCTKRWSRVMAHKASPTGLTAVEKTPKKPLPGDNFTALCQCQLPIQGQRKHMLTQLSNADGLTYVRMTPEMKKRKFIVTVQLKNQIHMSFIVWVGCIKMRKTFEHW